MSKKQSSRLGVEALEDRTMLSATPLTIAAALAHSPEAYSRFVSGAYQRFLDRTPASAEVAGWVTGMQHGLSDEQLEAGFIGSAEYIANHGGQGAGWVTGMYHDL